MIAFSYPGSPAKGHSYRRGNRGSERLRGLLKFRQLGGSKARIRIRVLLTPDLFLSSHPVPSSWQGTPEPPAGQSATGWHFKAGHGCTQGLLGGTQNNLLFVHSYVGIEANTCSFLIKIMIS